MQNNQLKDLAKQARTRLKNGYWEKIKADKAEKNGSIAIFSKQVQSVEMNCVNKKMQSATNVLNDGLYAKICEIVFSKQVVSNPIGILIDHSVYDKMNYDEKQRYILQLSSLYNEVKDKLLKVAN